MKIYVPLLTVKSFIHAIFNCIPNANSGCMTPRSQSDICCILLFSDSKGTKKQFFELGLKAWVSILKLELKRQKLTYRTHECTRYVHSTTVSFGALS